MTAAPDTASLPADKLPNELSAPYEVPHFPIEKIETKKLKSVLLSIVFTAIIPCLQDEGAED